MYKGQKADRAHLGSAADQHSALIILWGFLDTYLFLWLHARISTAGTTRVNELDPTQTQNAENPGIQFGMATVAMKQTGRRRRSMRCRATAHKQSRISCIAPEGIAGRATRQLDQNQKRAAGNVNLIIVNHFLLLLRFSRYLGKAAVLWLDVHLKESFSIKKAQQLAGAPSSLHETRSVLGDFTTLCTSRPNEFHQDTAPQAERRISAHAQQSVWHDAETR